MPQSFIIVSITYTAAAVFIAAAIKLRKVTGGPIKPKFQKTQTMLIAKRNHKDPVVILDANAFFKILEKVRL